MKQRHVARVLPITLFVLALVSPSAALAQDPDAAWRAGYDAFQKQDFRTCVTQMQTALLEKEPADSSTSTVEESRFDLIL